MGIQNIVQWFLPKENKFFTLLEQQADVLYKAANALSGFSNPSVLNAEISASVQDIEHEGDDLVQKVEEELASTFVTPIDREDIHNISSAIDDVIDLCNSAAKVCVIYNVQHPTQPMIDLMSIIVKCATELQFVMPSLRNKNYSQFLNTKKIVKSFEKDADTVYRNAIETLFHTDNLDYKVFFSQRSVLGKLESAVDCCNKISCLLANLAIKHA